jgi:hypothetical protein
MISARMLVDGLVITHERCSTKFKALKTLYKAVKDNNKQSGYGRKTFEYFDVSDSVILSSSFRNC